MLSKSLRAATVALLMGTATVAMATVSLTAPAEAASARPAVAKALQTAIREAASGNYGAARSAVAQAEAVGGLTAGDHAAIDQVKTYIAQKSGASGGKGGLVTDYTAGRYSEVIAAGRKGGLDGSSMQLVAQAYYLTRDFKGCTNYIRNNLSGGGETILQLQLRCAFESGDNEGQRTALEQLVQRTNKPEYWAQLLSTAESTRGLSDHQTLDIYRLKLLTGSIKTPDQYMLLAQLALQMGFAQEAANVVQKGIDAKLLNDGRTMRLLAMAKGQAAGNAANAGRAANGNGDALVKLGEDMWGQGKFPDALKFIQAGIGKGVTDKSNAQLRLGMAYLGGGQKDQAVRTFSHADGDPKSQVIAHLWEIYARTH